MIITFLTLLLVILTSIKKEIKSAGIHAEILGVFCLITIEILGNSILIISYLQQSALRFSLDKGSAICTIRILLKDK